MAALLIGYARVSTDEQDLTAQRDALATLGDRVRGVVVRSAEAEPDLAPR